MAIFQAYKGTDMVNPPLWQGLENYWSNSRIGIIDKARETVDRYGAVYLGSFQSDFDTGALTGGTVTSYAGTKNASDQFLIAGISAPILEIYRKGPIADKYPALFAGADAVNGSPENDVLAGFSGSDTMNGGAGNDMVWGGLGDDVILYSPGQDKVYGEEGFDVLRVDAPRTAFTVSRVDSTTLKLTQDSSNSVALNSIERVFFANKDVLALDVGPSENAGEAYRMYQAAFNRTPDSNGLAGWINFLDQGGNPLQMANQFIASSEFQKNYANLDSTGFVQLMYNNVLHRNGSASEVATWVDGLTNGLSRAEVLRGFSESAENVANLTPVIGNGVAYNQFWA